jgi:hypothetical protein
MSDPPATGQLLTTRDLPGSGKKGEPVAEHPFDHFHCGLTVSADEEWLVDDG